VKIVYFIIAYGPEFISNEVHEELGLRMRERGHEFVALTLTGRGSDQQRRAGLLRSESQNGVPIYKIVIGGDPRRAKLADAILHYNNFFTVLAGYKQFLHEYGRPDIMHVEAAYPLGAIAVLGTPTGGPAIIPNLQGADVLNYPQVDYGYGRWRLPRMLLRRTFARAALVRCNSALTRDLIVQEYGCAPAKAAVVLRNIGAWSYPPTDQPLADYKLAARARLEQQFPQLVGKRLILSISRLHPFKGIEYLLDAIARLSPGSSFSAEAGGVLPMLMIAGPGRSTAHFGDYGAYLRAYAERCGIAEQVIFSGEIQYTQSRDYLAAADAVAISSVVDALNKVALEAAAVATPVVLTTTTGAAELIAEHGCGLAVAPESGAALAAGLREVLSDRFDRLGLLTRGPAFAEQFRSVPIADQLLELYARALRERELRAYADRLCGLPARPELAGGEQRADLLYQQGTTADRAPNAGAAAAPAGAE